MHIKSIQSIQPFTSPHGEVVREQMGNAAGGSIQHSMAHITLPAGTASLKHYHPVAEESYFILSGQARFELDGLDSTLNPGDAVAIPANTVHQIFNDSAEDLVFLAICVLPWTPDCSVVVD